MKKLAILFVVMALFLLSGCQESNKLFEIDNQAKFSVSLKLVTEKEEYPEKDTVIRYTIMKQVGRNDPVSPQNL